MGLPNLKGKFYGQNSCNFSITSVLCVYDASSRSRCSGQTRKWPDQGTWRIPERTLFTLALLGGSPGAILGMLVFHHKTKHIKFVIGLPTILVLESLLLLAILFA